MLIIILLISYNVIFTFFMEKLIEIDKTSGFLRKNDKLAVGLTELS